MEKIREHSGWSLFLACCVQFGPSLKVVVESKQPFDYYFPIERMETQKIHEFIETLLL